MQRRELVAGAVGIVLPGAGTIVLALAAAQDYCERMKENEDRCTLELKRLKLVHEKLNNGKAPNSTALAVLAGVIEDFVALLKKQSAKIWIKRFITMSKFDEDLQKIRSKIDHLDTLLLAEMKEAQQEGLELATDTDKKATLILSKMEALEAQFNRVRNEKLMKQASSTFDNMKELRDNDAKEVAAELKHAIDKFEALEKRKGGSVVQPEILQVMKETLAMVVRTKKIAEPTNPSWFIPSDDVTLSDSETSHGSFGKVRHGKWEQVDVVVKRLLDSDAMVQKKFRTEIDLWSQFNHPHVLRLYGGCDVSTPAFFVCEYASNGNFADYFRTPANKEHMWRLFYEAALGLKYLHKNMVVHGDLKCNNLLVGRDGLAKISDFGFSFSRTQSKQSKKAQSSSARWKALECQEGNPHFASDLYAFGMCIIEAVTGKKPWPSVEEKNHENAILDLLEEGKTHPRPATGFTDEQWELVSGLCKIKQEDRIRLDLALVFLEQFANEAERDEGLQDNQAH